VYVSVHINVAGLSVRSLEHLVHTAICRDKNTIICVCVCAHARVCAYMCVRL
jgi:hypothetical protein